MRGTLCFMAVVWGLLCTVTASGESIRYRRKDIADARFGTGEREKLLLKARTFSADVGQIIRGQEIPSLVLQDRLVKYLENFPNRKGEPIGLNFIGLPGVGKSAMLAQLRNMGITVIHFDAQRYAVGTANFADDAINALNEPVKGGKPVVLIVEEIDKVSEFDSAGKEVTSPMIATLNQITSDGIISAYGRVFDMSNVLVLTSMNFSPNEIGTFSQEVLGQAKSFYDFSIEDFVAFDKWVKESPGARYKILSKLFRSNTVGRLAPNTVLMEPLREDVYRDIIAMNIQWTIKRNTTVGAAATDKTPNMTRDKRISVEVDPSVVDFLVKEAVYAPSGARETVLRTNALIEQLIHMGVKAEDPKGSSLDQPRLIQISADGESQKARIVITPRVLIAKELQDRPSFTVTAPYRRDARLFSEPENIAVTKPTYPKPPERPYVLTKKRIREARFPKSVDMTKGLTDAIEDQLLGQETTARAIQDDLNRYLGRSGPAKKEPSYRILAGFPGIGKSEIVKIVAKHLGLEIIRVNMQQFSASDANSVSAFFDSVTNAIEQNPKAKDGKFILLIEEFDKVFEIAPNGSIVNRPVIAPIKDLLNDGIATYVSKTAYADRTKTIDIRGAFSFVTMNFSIDRFGFRADPRITTVEDVIAAWTQMKSTPMSVKGVLGSMFLPETVSRLMSRLTIMKPPNRAEYREIVRKQTEGVLKQRIYDSEGRNVAQITIDTTDSYENYLLSETVIPSEGARNTVVGSSGLLATDLEDALRNLPRSSQYAAVPVVVTLDFNPEKTSVLISIRKSDEDTSQNKVLFEKPVALNFPPLTMEGQIPEERLLTAAHEFGHALMAERLGQRFESVVVVSPTPSIGGFVKFKGGMKATDSMGQLFGLLGARALERMVLSPNPLADDSVMDITAGPSNDIKQASLTLFNMLFELGFDPSGGTIDRNFVTGPGKYADFASIPAPIADQLGKALRALENEIVRDLLTSASMGWYVDKIVKLAHQGAMSEAEFYELVGDVYPQNDPDSFGVNSHLQAVFGDQVLPRDASVAAAQAQKRGSSGRTVLENSQLYLSFFKDVIERHFHKGDTPSVAGASNINPLNCDELLSAPPTVHEEK